MQSNTAYHDKLVSLVALLTPHLLAVRKYKIVHVNKFTLKDHRIISKLKHIRPNHVTFGSNSLEPVGPQIWNGLQNKLKFAENSKNFKLLESNEMARIRRIFCPPGRVEST